MKILQRLWFAFRSAGNRSKFESEMSEEIADFLERDVQEKIAQGLTPEAAKRAALVELQGVQQTKERVRELHPGMWLETLWQDIRYALRTLRKRPAYAVLALATMALGIGANTAIFSVVRGVLLESLPYRDSGRLVLLQTRAQEERVPQVAFSDFTDVREEHTGIEDATAFLFEAFVMQNRLTGGEPQPVRNFGLRVTPSFFNTLGIQPSLGRGFTREEAVPGKNLVAVLSDRLWKENYGGHSDALGRTIVLDDQPHVIVGVMPANFEMFLPMTETFTITDTEIYVPLSKDHDLAQHRSIFTFEVIARLQENVSQAQAEAELEQISHSLARKYPDTNTGRTLEMIPLRAHVTGGARPALYLLIGAVISILLVACANLANLMIGRVSAREQELAVRAALGASRGRLVRQLLAESTLLVLLGGVAGVLLSWILMPQITERLASRVPGAASISLNSPVLIFAILVCLLTGIASGLLPARVLWQRKSGHSLQGAGRSSAGTGQARLRKGLVVTEIALSCVLLAAAILLGGSFLKLMRVPLGFDARELLTFQTTLSQSRFHRRIEIAQTLTELTRRIEALPGIERATATGSLPLSGHNTGSALYVQGRSLSPGAQPPEVRWQFVQQGYFEAMHIPLLRGRLFEERDIQRQPHVTLISESVALRDFPNEDPIGKFVSYGPPGKDVELHEVLGVVGDIRHGALREEPSPRVYDLLGQHADFSVFIAVRTTQNATQIMPGIRAIVSQLDPGAPVYDVRTMEQWMTRSVNREQTLAALVGLFALASLFLGAVGAYGVISSLVAQRTREIGIRMALGASPASILRSTIGEGLQLAVAGLAIGMLVMFGTGPMLRGILFGVKYADPRALAIVAAGLLFVALAACYIPARRAARVDAVITLRQE